jgi:hypothetical protein
VRDPLYLIFEKHLMTALVEDETLEEFLACVVTGYVGHLRTNGTVIPASHLSTIETDIREEVLEMFRKKTYGFFNLASYRQANGIEATPSMVPALAPENEKARRGGRAS